MRGLTIGRSAGSLLILVLAVSPIAIGQSTPNTTQAHCAAAKAAAGADHVRLYERFTDICSETPQPARGQGRQGGGGGGRGAAQAPPARDTWYHEPAKVFDNLYFIGTRVHNAWALQTSEGLIMIDSLYGYAAKDEQIDGLRKIGLNPATMKYLIVSHGHGDHHGGAKLLQDEFGPRVVMGGPDWDLVAKTQATTPPPKKDMVATDGQKITLGDTTVTIYLTPGHTEGTLSLLIPVKDNGRSHLIATWGGTALSRSTPPGSLQAYVASAVKYRALLAKLGVEGMVSNHSEFDDAVVKIGKLASRKAGEPHPFLPGKDSVRRYMTVVEEVGRAALALPKP